MPETAPPELDFPSDIPPKIAARLRSVNRTHVVWCVMVMAVLSVASLLGTGSSAYLVNHYPLLLVGLSPRLIHMVLVSITVNPAAFVAVVVIRRSVFYLAAFHMGRILGPVAVDWLEYRTPRAGRFIRWLHVLFTRAPRAVVFFLPGPSMSTIAGSAGMRTRIFLFLSSLGLVFRAIFVIELAKLFQESIKRFLGWLDESWIPTTVVILAVMAIYQWKSRSLSREAVGS